MKQPPSILIKFLPSLLVSLNLPTLVRHLHVSLVPSRRLRRWKIVGLVRMGDHLRLLPDFVVGMGSEPAAEVLVMVSVLVVARMPAYAEVV